MADQHTADASVHSIPDLLPVPILSSHLNNLWWNMIISKEVKIVLPHL
jgi:hypothetical protein